MVLLRDENLSPIGSLSPLSHQIPPHHQLTPMSFAYKFLSQKSGARFRGRLSNLVQFIRTNRYTADDKRGRTGTRKNKIKTKIVYVVMFMHNACVGRKRADDLQQETRSCIYYIMHILLHIRVYGNLGLFKKKYAVGEC